MAEATLSSTPVKRYPALPLIKISMRGRVKEPIATFSSSCAAFLYLKRMMRLDREEFWALHLNNKNKCIGYEVVSVGSLTASIVHPREVFKGILLNNAAAVIFAHNHPSGDPEPSREDIEITERLKNAGDILGIRVLDHIVIGRNKFISLADRGHL